MLQRKEVVPVLNKSVVLLDIESLIFKARESLPATVDNIAIARIIGKHLLEIAERHGELVGAYMATSIARARDPVGLQRRYETWAIADALNGIGYSTLLVPIGPNAADTELCRIAYEHMKDSSINTYVIGTGDGREPFYSLFKGLERVGLQVHVVVWDVVQHVVRFSETFRVSRLCDSFRSLMENNEDAQPSS